MSADLPTYSTLQALTGSSNSPVGESAYISRDDISEYERLKNLSGVQGYGEAIFDSDSHNAMEDLGMADPSWLKKDI